jgi:hypothetical protein
MHRFKTHTASRAGEGGTLYVGDSLTKAIWAASGFKEVPGRETVHVVDDNYVDMDDNGEVDWKGFTTDDPFAFAEEIEYYLTNGR